MGVADERDVFPEPGGGGCIEEDEGGDKSRERQEQGAVRAVRGAQGQECSGGGDEQLQPAEGDGRWKVLLGGVGGVWEREDGGEWAEMALDIDMAELLGDQAEFDGVGFEEGGQPVKSGEEQRQGNRQREPQKDGSSLVRAPDEEEAVERQERAAVQGDQGMQGE